MFARGSADDADESSTRWSSGSRCPWRPQEWRTTLEIERVADAYLSSKPLAEQLELARMMRDIEAPLPSRSTKTTDNVPFLQRPGAAAILAAAWHAQLKAAR